MEGVERINVVMVCLNQQARFAPHNLYAMKVDHRNRNCYNYRGFGYMARQCRNQEIKESRRLEYIDRNNGQRKTIKEENRQNNNLNRDKNLIVLN